MSDEYADCERHDDWFLGQDVNAWSSLAYVAVGAVIAVLVLRRRIAPAFLALAASVTLVGVGSLLYHGEGGDAAQLLHDAPLVGALGFVAGWHAGRMLDRAGLWAIAGAIGGVAVGAAASAVSATNAAVALAVAVIVVTELLARRRGCPAIWTARLVGLAGLAAVTWLAGTSGSPLCDTESWLQPHGAWHVLSALVLLAWTDGAAASLSGEASWHTSDRRRTATRCGTDPRRREPPGGH